MEIPDEPAPTTTTRGPPPWVRVATGRVEEALSTALDLSGCGHRENLVLDAEVAQLGQELVRVERL